MATSDPRYQDLLRRLRDARARLHLSQQAVARQLRKPQSYVSKCESGERRLDAIELNDFATLYGQPLAFFLGTAHWREPHGSLRARGLGLQATRVQAGRRQRGSGAGA